MTVTASLAFGKVAVGQTVTKYLTVHNTNNTNSLIISSATPSDAEYAVTGGGTCGAIPVTVARTKSCTIGVSFTPDAPGAHSASIPIFDNTAGSPQQVALSGTCIVDLTTSKSSMVFGSFKFGASAAMSLGVTNHQTQPVTLSESIGGTNSADFSITGGTCAATLGAGKGCKVIVTFTPGALGTESATLTVSDGPDPLSPYPVALSTGPTIPDTVSPLALAYGTVSRSSSKTLDTTVINKSPFTILIGSAVSGADAADFTITGGTCGSSLGGNSSCMVGVKFKPATDGAQSALLIVSIPQDPTNPHTVSLTGTGK